MRKFFGSTGSVSRLTVESQAVKSRCWVIPQRRRLPDGAQLLLRDDQPYRHDRARRSAYAQLADDAPLHINASFRLRLLARLRCQRPAARYPRLRPLGPTPAKWTAPPWAPIGAGKHSTFRRVIRARTFMLHSMLVPVMMPSLMTCYSPKHSQA